MDVFDGAFSPENLTGGTYSGVSCNHSVCTPSGGWAAWFLFLGMGRILGVRGQ